MKYFKPIEVLSPRDKISDVVEIYDNGISRDAFSLAQFKWDGTPCIGIRWNIREDEWDDENKKNGNVTCLGSPSSFNNPTWFVLPVSFLQMLINSDGNLTDKIKKYL